MLIAWVSLMDLYEMKKRHCISTMHRRITPFKNFKKKNDHNYLPIKKPRRSTGVSNKCSTFIYIFTQFVFVQQGFCWHSGGQVCSVHCLLRFCFLGFLPLAKAPVANEQTNASISIFFIMLFYNEWIKWTAKKNSHWVASRPVEYKRLYWRCLSTGNFLSGRNILRLIHTAAGK